MNKENALMNLVVDVFLFFALVLVRSTSIKLIWNWFLTLSLGVKSIEAPVALGIVLFVALFKGPLTKEDKETLNSGRSVYLTEILSCIFTVSIGWFVHEFIV